MLGIGWVKGDILVVTADENGLVARHIAYINLAGCIAQEVFCFRVEEFAQTGIVEIVFPVTLGLDYHPVVAKLGYINVVLVFVECAVDGCLSYA